MSRFKAGIVTSAGDAGAGPPSVTYFIADQDWRVSSVPAGWTSLDANDGYDVDHGVYSTAVNAPAVWQYDSTPGPFTSFSVIMVNDVTEWVQVDNVVHTLGDGDSPFEVYSRYWPGIAIDNHAVTNNVSSQTISTDPGVVGVQVIAGIFYLDGTLKLFVYNPGAVSPDIFTAGWGPSTTTPTALTVQASAYDSATPADGDSSKAKVRYTRIAMNEHVGGDGSLGGELSEADVTTRAIAYGWVGGLPDLDPDNFESDWTASLVAPPTGWTENTDDGQTYTYTATGAYGNDANDTVADVWSHTLSRDVSAMTVIVAYTIANWGSLSGSLQIGDGGDGIATYMSYHTTDDDGYMSMDLDGAGSLTSSTLHNTDPTGLVIVAGTFFQDGSRAFYKFDDDGAATIDTDAGPTPTVHSLVQATVLMQNYDFNNSVAGTPGDLRFHHTYLGFDEELDLAAITAIVTGWGWTP